MIAIELNSDSTMADLREVLGRVRKPERMLKVIAKRAEDELKGYFRTRDLISPNKLGAERKHFWQQVADSVTGEEDAAGSTVRLGIAHPHFAQKLYGGVIRVKSARALTIPVTPEAYGKTTKEFQAATGLRLFRIKPHGKEWLATRLKGAKEVTVQYLLKPSVNQAADPEALPDMEKLGAVVVEAVKEELEK